jgi:hypothetical protein
VAFSNHPSKSSQTTIVSLQTTKAAAETTKAQLQTTKPAVETPKAAPQTTKVHLQTPKAILPPSKKHQTQSLLVNPTHYSPNNNPHKPKLPNPTKSQKTHFSTPPKKRQQILLISNTRML